MRISDWSSDVCSSDLFIARRGPHRHAMARFERMLSPWLGRLERLVKPRLSLLLDHRVAGLLSGLLLVLLGLLLALPLPFTNYIFGRLRSEARRFVNERIHTCRYSWSSYQ